MSSYIIAGSADSTDTAYCEEIARRIKAKYRNIDFRIVIKHPTQWDGYLQQICRIYGFLNKSNPIIYTLDGKIIGNRDAFMGTATKYFGVDESTLLVPNISNKINMKQAQQQIAKKKAIKNNIKSMSEKVEGCYNNLLKKKILKLELVNNQYFLHNGVQFSYREVQGICPNMVFLKQKKIDVIFQEIKPQQIDLMALSLNDQIKPEDTGKETFVTNNQPIQAIEERMSEVSRTNRMQQSIISHENNSKGFKQSTSKLKSRIDQQFDDLTDYVDYPLTQTVVCELGDNFYLAFETKTYIKGQMIMYLNEDPNGNKMRVYNDGRPVKGHRSIVPINEEPEQEQVNEIQQQISMKIQSQQNIEDKNNNKQQDQKGGKVEEVKIQKVQKVQKVQKIQKVQKKDISSKLKTDGNIPEEKKKVEEAYEGLSEPPSDMNLVSNLNYHTLNISHPLSILQLKVLLNLLQQTKSIATLQFLPQNPNPRIKVYYRDFLTNKNLLPIENFINKKIQQNDYQIINLTQYKDQPPITVTHINSIGFNHFYYPHVSQQLHQQNISRVIRAMVNQALKIQETIRKEIGYNLIITKQYTMLVPLIEPYRRYNNINLYLDGLAYLGFIHIAKVAQPYSTHIQDENEKRSQILSYLSRCSGLQPQK